MRWSMTLALALCLHASGAAPSNAGSLGGTVRDASTLAAVPGATVTLHVVQPDSIEISTVSDGSGAYLFPDVPPANEVYWLICQKGGYSIYYARLQDLGTSNVVFDILLQVEPPPPDPGDPPDSSDVSGRVLQAGSLAPIPNATLTLRSGASVYLANTAGDGRYAVSVPVDVYTVTVEAGGYQPVSDSGIEAGGSGCNYDAVLEPELVGVPGTGGESKPIALHGARPNPFVRATAIHFSLPEPGPVALGVHDLLGREVRSIATGWMDAGAHAVPFTADGLPAGTYFCRLVFRGRVAVVPMTRLR